VFIEAEKPVLIGGFGIVVYHGDERRSHLGERAADRFHVPWLGHADPRHVVDGGYVACRVVIDAPDDKHALRRRLEREDLRQASA
jgi:hypothetical protein